jgi:hypothetical protein
MLLFSHGCRIFRVFRYSKFISLRWNEPYYDKFSVTSMKKAISEVPGRFYADSNSENLDPKIPSRRRGIPSGRSSVKHHPSGRQELSIRTPLCVQKLRTVPSCISQDVLATHPDALQCLTSKQISF